MTVCDNDSQPSNRSVAWIKQCAEQATPNITSPAQRVRALGDTWSVLCAGIHRSARSGYQVVRTIGYRADKHRKHRCNVLHLRPHRARETSAKTRSGTTS